MSENIFILGETDVRRFDNSKSYTGGMGIVYAPGGGHISYNSGSPPTITTDLSDFIISGFVPGDIIYVEGTRSNDGLYHVVDVSADTLTLDSIHTLSNETPSFTTRIVKPLISAIRGAGYEDHAELYAYENSNYISVPAQDTMYQVDVYNTNGYSYGAFPDLTNNRIDINTTGRYKISARLDFASSSAETYVLGVHQYVSGLVGVGLPNMITKFKTSSDIDDPKLLCLNGLADLSDGDYIDIEFMRLTGGSAPVNVLIRNISLSVVQIR